MRKEARKLNYVRTVALAAVLSFLAACSYPDLQFRAEVHRAMTHIKTHQDAFKALGKALDQHPEIESVGICDPPKCYDGSEADERTQTEEEFVTLLEKLGFPSPNGLFFQRRKDGAVWIPNMGAGLWDTSIEKIDRAIYVSKQVSLSYVYSETPHEMASVGNCIEASLREEELLCYEPMMEGWWLEFDGLTVTFDPANPPDWMQ